MGVSMQEISWFLTLILLAVLAAIFFAVIRQAAIPAANPVTARNYRYRQPLFWGLAVVGIAVTFGTLIPWPYGPSLRADESPLRVNAISEQWSWSIDRTDLPLNKPVVFFVTSRDVNHGFGLYGPDRRLLTQVQAMPGYVNKVHYTFTKPGQYRVLCLEYCGLIHHDMTAELTVKP
jgi:cytochrome c oxidase subunit 2